MAFVPILVKSRGYTPGLRPWAIHWPFNLEKDAREPGTPYYVGQNNDDSGSQKNQKKCWQPTSVLQLCARRRTRQGGLREFFEFFVFIITPSFLSDRRGAQPCHRQTTL